MSKDKDPRRQLMGKISKAKGKHFEERLDTSFAYYRDCGYAIIEKTPEPDQKSGQRQVHRFL